MATNTCTACGKEIPADALRCSHCGHIQGFGRNKSMDGLIQHEPVANLQLSHGQKPDENESLKVGGSGNNSGVAEPAPTSPGKLKRLNQMLSGQSAGSDLDILRREGLLPDHELVNLDASNLPEGKPKFDAKSDGLPSTDLPAWLRNAGATSEEYKTQGSDTSTEDEPAAAPAEIPDWVRKLQNKIQNHADEPQANKLEADSIDLEPATDQLHKTGSRQSKPLPGLEFRELENNLIESVVTYLGGLKASRKIPADKNRRLARMVWGAIGLAMISLAAALLWSGSSVSALSQPAVADLADMTAYIESLSPDAVVLMGMDYDVSLAGEMDNAALPVLVHLMRKQVSLVFVSTRPTGSALSSHLIDLGMTWLPDYPEEKAFVFTYLPGEAAGLLQLATRPRQALTIELDGSNPWITPELAGIQDISDFSLVIVLTDSTGSGRDWLEQVQPRLSGVPLFAIVSKQAEPMYRPYRESGQLQALMVGISEGADYERVYLITTNNQRMMRAYDGLLLFIAVLLACVILLSVFPQPHTGISARRPRKNASR